MDASKWEHREERFRKKFAAGQRYIPGLFSGLDLPNEIDQQAIFVFASTKNYQSIGGGRVVHISAILEEIFGKLKSTSLYKNAVPEHLAILRSFQFVAQYKDSVFRAIEG
jgi:hypothetical protein